MTLTVDMASKLLKQYNLKILELRDLCLDRMVYTTDESRRESDKPDFSFTDNTTKIASYFKKVQTIKHAINKFNTTYKAFHGKTIDELLVEVSFLTSERNRIRNYINTQAATRVPAKVTGVNEYRYINFDPKDVDEYYNTVESMIFEIQSAINKANVTQEIEINI